MIKFICHYCDNDSRNAMKCYQCISAVLIVTVLFLNDSLRTKIKCLSVINSLWLCLVLRSHVSGRWSCVSCEIFSLNLMYVCMYHFYMIRPNKSQKYKKTLYFTYFKICKLFPNKTPVSRQYMNFCFLSRCLGRLNCFNIQTYTSESPCPRLQKLPQGPGLLVSVLVPVHSRSLC